MENVTCNMLIGCGFDAHNPSAHFKHSDCMNCRSSQTNFHRMRKKISVNSLMVFDAVFVCAKKFKMPSFRANFFERWYKIEIL